MDAGHIDAGHIDVLKGFYDAHIKGKNVEEQQKIIKKLNPEQRAVIVEIFNAIGEDGKIDTRKLMSNLLKNHKIQDMTTILKEIGAFNPKTIDTSKPTLFARGGFTARLHSISKSAQDTIKGDRIQVGTVLEKFQQHVAPEELKKLKELENRMALAKLLNPADLPFLQEQIEGLRKEIGSAEFTAEARSNVSLQEQVDSERTRARTNDIDSGLHSVPRAPTERGAGKLSSSSSEVGGISKSQDPAKKADKKTELRQMTEAVMGANKEKIRETIPQEILKLTGDERTEKLKAHVKQETDRLGLERYLITLGFTETQASGIEAIKNDKTISLRKEITIQELMYNEIMFNIVPIVQGR